MHDFQLFKQNAVKYWERRRIIYNLALVLPGWFGFGITDTMNFVGEVHEVHYAYVLWWFAWSAVGANVCYSFAYSAEFIFGSDDPTSRWLRFGRSATFVGGVLFAMLLALIGGYNIAMMHWNYGIRHAGQKTDDRALEFARHATLRSNSTPTTKVSQGETLVAL